MRAGRSARARGTYCQRIQRWLAQVISPRAVLPGDVIELEAGDSIPADATIVRFLGLHTHEGALTGESPPVEQDATHVLPSSTPLGGRRNMVYWGTAIASGKATAVVSATSKLS